MSRNRGDWQVPRSRKAENDAYSHPQRAKTAGTVRDGKVGNVGRCAPRLFEHGHYGRHEFGAVILLRSPGAADDGTVPVIYANPGESRRGVDRQQQCA